jgi:hypothetical protein
MDYNDGLELYIPPHMHDGVRRYLDNHIKPGSFLQAVFEGNWEWAGRKADGVNASRLHDYVSFLREYADPESFGSKEKVAAWLVTC